MSPNRSAPGPGSDGSTRPALSRRALLGGSTAALASLAGCVSGGPDVVVGKHDTTESTYDLAAGSLRVDVELGRVAVRETGDDVVRVRTEKSGSLLSSLSAVSVSSRRDDDAVVVTGSFDGDGVTAVPRVEVRVDVPAGVTVESMHVQNGDATVRDASVAEGTPVRSTNGDAVAERVDGDVVVATRNGDAVAEAVTGFVTARSVNGDAVVRRCGGVDGAATTNGDVSVEVSALRGDARLESVNGDVTAALAPDLDARLVASTERGDLSVDVPVDRATDTGTRVEGTVGDGGHVLRLVTTNGDVMVSRLGA